MLITPEEPPEARRGCSSKAGTCQGKVKQGHLSKDVILQYCSECHALMDTNRKLPALTSAER